MSLTIGVASTGCCGTIVSSRSRIISERSCASSSFMCAEPDESCSVPAPLPLRRLHCPRKTTSSPPMLVSSRSLRDWVPQSIRLGRAIFPAFTLTDCPRFRRSGVCDPRPIVQPVAGYICAALQGSPLDLVDNSSRHAPMRRSANRLSRRNDDAHLTATDETQPLLALHRLSPC